MKEIATSLAYPQPVLRTALKIEIGNQIKMEAIRTTKALAGPERW